MCRQPALGVADKGLAATQADPTPDRPARGTETLGWAGTPLKFGMWFRAGLDWWDHLPEKSP